MTLALPKNIPGREWLLRRPGGGAESSLPVLKGPAPGENVVLLLSPAARRGGSTAVIHCQVCILLLRLEHSLVSQFLTYLPSTMALVSSGFCYK